MISKIKNIASRVEISQVIVTFSICLLLVSIPLLVVYFWEVDLDSSKAINHEKFGTFGDFFGGVIGATWSLAGVLLFYITLKDQRSDFKNNRDALSKQVEALVIQTNEFKLQRDELKMSRDVFIDQAKALKKQNLESTYFSLLEIYRDIVQSYNNKYNNDYFFILKEDLYRIYSREIKNENEHEVALKCYETIFFEKKEELSKYFKFIYRIVKIVDQSDIEYIDKIQYLKILRSQLTENELLILYYNAHTVFGGKFYKFIVQYNLLKHLSPLNKLEMSGFTASNKEFLSRTHTVLIDLTEKVIIELADYYRDSDYEYSRASQILTPEDCLMITVVCGDYNELEIGFVDYANSKYSRYLLSDDFSSYMKIYIDDLFVRSRFSPLPMHLNLEKNITNEEVIFKIISNEKLSLNTD